MKSASGHPTSRRNKKLRQGPQLVKQHGISDQGVDIASRLTGIVCEAARIRKAFELAVSEFFEYASLVERLLFALLRALSVSWLLCFIFIRHWRSDGAWDFILNIACGVILLFHVVDVTRKLVKPPD